MNRDDVIRWADEADLWADQELQCVGEYHPDWHEVRDIRFAALVAAAEREKVAAWMIQRGYATGHGDTTEDLLKELDWQVLANWSSAMKTGAENEREACAKVLDEMAAQDKWTNYYAVAANTIRARRQA